MPRRAADPDNDTLTYAWTFGDGQTGTGRVVSHTYASAGSRTVSLTVTDGRGGSNAISQVVSVGVPPTGVIQTPASTATYAANQTIGFSGTATDADGSVLPASAFSWTIVFHHDTHYHPFAGPINGVRSGSFVVPDVGETAANVWYRVHLTVRNAAGLEHRSYRDVRPRTATVTLQTQPAGGTLTLDGQPVATPHNFTSVVGVRRAIGAPETMAGAGGSINFSSWSDGGARVHDINTPAANSTYTARFDTAVPSGSPRETYLRFDGADDHVAVLSAADLGQGNALTVAAWFRLAVNGERLTLISKGGSSDEQWMLSRVGSNNKIVFSVRNAAGTRAVADSPSNFANDLAWHHVAGVYDGVRVQIYVDGSLAGTISQPLTGAVRSGASVICIGARTGLRRMRHLRADARRPG